MCVFDLLHAYASKAGSDTSISAPILIWEIGKISPLLIKCVKLRFESPTWGWNSSVDNVLGLLSCGMQCCGFDPPLILQ